MGLVVGLVGLVGLVVGLVGLVGRVVGLVGLVGLVVGLVGFTVVLVGLVVGLVGLTVGRVMMVPVGGAGGPGGLWVGLIVGLVMTVPVGGAGGPGVTSSCSRLLLLHSLQIHLFWHFFLHSSTGLLTQFWTGRLEQTSL